MRNDIERILFTKDEIAEKVKYIAKQLKSAYADKNPLILCVLKGSLIFTADLVRELDFPCTIDFLQASSYGNGSTSGELKIKKDVDSDVAGRHVIVIEDILDTGRTLSRVLSMLNGRNPKSLALCVFLDKPERRETKIIADYTGYIIENEFVVGYGLDYDEKYRNLPYIGVLKREIYER